MAEQSGAMAGGKALTPTTLSRAREVFIATLAKTGQVTLSAKAAKIDRVTAYAWRKKNEEFALAWNRALDLAGDMLEDEAVNRAMNGSDGLLTLLLKAHKPERFRERSEVQLTGSLEISDKLRKARERVNGGN